MSEAAINQTYNLEGLRKITVLEVARESEKRRGTCKDQLRARTSGDFGGKDISAAKAQRDLG